MFIAVGVMGLIGADMLLTMAVLSEMGITAPVAVEQGVAAFRVTAVSAFLLMGAFLAPVARIAWRRARQRFRWGETA